MIVLDTNVVSELLRPAPAKQVQTWLTTQDPSLVYFTAVSEAELRHGVAILAAGKRRTALAAAISHILNQDFRGRILPFDSQAAQAYAAPLSPLNGALLAAPSARLIARSLPSHVPMRPA